MLTFPSHRVSLLVKMNLYLLSLSRFRRVPCSVMHEIHVNSYTDSHFGHSQNVPENYCLEPLGNDFLLPD
jgi:hypothetical protein